MHFNKGFTLSLNFFSVLLTENQAMYTWKMQMWNCSSLTNMGITSIILSSECTSLVLQCIHKHNACDQ